MKLREMLMPTKKKARPKDTVEAAAALLETAHDEVVAAKRRAGDLEIKLAAVEEELAEANRQLRYYRGLYERPTGRGRTSRPR